MFSRSSSIESDSTKTSESSEPSDATREASHEAGRTTQADEAETTETTETSEPKTEVVVSEQDLALEVSEVREAVASSEPSTSASPSASPTQGSLIVSSPIIKPASSITSFNIIQELLLVDYYLKEKEEQNKKLPLKHRLHSTSFTSSLKPLDYWTSQFPGNKFSNAWATLNSSRRIPKADRRNGTLLVFGANLDPMLLRDQRLIELRLDILHGVSRGQTTDTLLKLEEIRSLQCNPPAQGGEPVSITILLLLFSISH